MKRYIGVALAVLTTATISNSAVLKGFSNSFSTQSVGASNTGCATWEECLGNSNNNGAGGGNGLGNSNPNWSYSSQGVAKNLYYLKYYVAGLKKHPDFKFIRDIGYGVESHNTMSYVRAIIENNIKKLPLCGDDIFTGERVPIRQVAGTGEDGTTFYRNLAYAFDQYSGYLLKNDDGTYSFFVSSIDISKPRSRYVSYDSSLDYTLYRYVLNKDFVVKSKDDPERRRTAAYYFDDYYGNHRYRLRRSIKIKNQKDNSFTIYNFIQVDYNFILCRYSIKKDNSGRYNFSENTPSCWKPSISLSRPRIIDIYHKQGETFMYIGDIYGHIAKYDLDTGIGSSPIISNKTDTVVPKELRPKEFYNPLESQEVFEENVVTSVDKSYFILDGKKYLVDPITGGLKEEEVVYSFPPKLYVKARDVELDKLQEGEMKVIQPTTPSNGYCEYKIKYKATDNKIYNFIFKSLIYDKGANKCYTLTNLIGKNYNYPHKGFLDIAVGDKLYTTGAVDFKEVKGHIVFTGYSTKENGNNVFYMLGYGNSDMVKHMAILGKVLFKSPKDGKYYLLLNNNLVLELDGVNDSTEFFDEVIIK